MIEYVLYVGGIFARLDGCECMLKDLDMNKKVNMKPEEFFEMLEGEFRSELAKENLAIIDGRIEEINYEEV